MTDTAAEVKVGGNYRFVVAWLLFIASVINYLDRAALGVAAPYLQDELQLTSAELGIVFSAFFLGYTLFAFVGGRLADRYGPCRVFAWAAGSWSVFCAITGAVSTFSQLLIARVLFGFAEGPVSSVSSRMIANWFPRKEASRAIGFTFSGQMLGGAIAAPVLGLLALRYGWRIAFLVIGTTGLVWVLAWRRFATDWPHQSNRVDKREIELIGRKDSDQHGASEVLAAGSLRAHLFVRSTLALGFGLFSINYTVFVLLSWLPSYLRTAHLLGPEEISYLAAIPWLGGCIGFALGGVLSDLIYVRMKEPLSARKVTTAVPQGFGALTLIGVIASPSAGVAVVLISATLMFLMCSVQSLWATIRELVPTEHIGGVSGFVHMLSNISGIIGPLVTGITIQYFGGYSSVFLIAGILLIAGTISTAIFVKRSRTRAVCDKALLAVSGE